MVKYVNEASSNYSRRHMQWDRGASASLPRFGISAVIDVLSLLTIAIFLPNPHFYLDKVNSEAVLWLIGSS
jgi:hypothetical protein